MPMSELTRSAFGRDRFTLLIVLLSGLGAAHILVRTATYGAAVNPDTTLHLSTALNFLAGEGWRDFAGGPSIEWPPLFPVLLAALGWVGIDPLAAGRWINAAAFGLTILAAGGWLRSNLRSQWLVLTATATIAASLPLTHFASYCITEPLFVLLTLLALIQLASSRNRRTDAPLWWAAVLTALAVLTHYLGAVLIGAGVLLLRPLARPKHTLAFGAVSSLPLLAVLAVNWTVSETLAGDRTAPSGQSLFERLRQTVEVFREWVVPPHTPDGLAYLLWLAVGLVVLAGVAVVLRGRRLGPAVAPAQSRLGPAFPFAVFALIYLGFMVVVVPFTVAQDIDSRYLLPVYLPLLLTTVLLLDRFLSVDRAGAAPVPRIRNRFLSIAAPVQGTTPVPRIRNRAAGRFRAAGRGRAAYGLAALVLLAALVHVGYSARENLRLTARAYAVGYKDRTYNAAYWRRSETLQYLREHPIEGRIYSNYAALAWFADRTAAPGKYQGLPPERQWTEVGTGAHIVWFEGVHAGNRSGDDLDLRLLPGVETVAELADGVVFRLTGAGPFQKGRYMELEELVRQATQAGEQVVRSGWDVYRNGRWLTYLKQPCAPADAQAKFVLHVIPVDLADLPAARKQYGFDNLDFYFNRRGVLLGDQCIALVRLPDYAIDHVRVGQWIAEENQHLWGAEFFPDQ